MKNFSKLEKRLGLEFKNKDLFKTVFVHRSYLNEHPDFPLPSNERLEFLGDAVLELIVTEHLYKNYTEPEGILTAWRSALVRGKMLSRLAKKLDLPNYLFLSKGEAKSGGRNKEIILANTFEALIGAIYLDQGYKTAQEFVNYHLISHLPEIIEKRLYLDPKTRFQEIVQEKIGITPSYKLIKEEGPDHAKTFTMGVYIQDKLIAKGTGPSKQAAETQAAAKAIEIWEE